MQRTYTVTQEKIDQYGVLNGDKDIIHYDLDYAKKRGFEGTLAHGLMVQGYANDVALALYGEDWLTRGAIKVKFVAPIYPDEDYVVEVTPAGELTASGKRGVVMVGTAKLRN